MSWLFRIFRYKRGYEDGWEDCYVAFRKAGAYVPGITAKPKGK